jgi:hypothetical protein
MSRTRKPDFPPSVVNRRRAGMGPAGDTTGNSTLESQMFRWCSPRRLGPAVLAALVTLIAVHSQPERARAADAPDATAVARARETVKLLDDLHKGYVVTITATYVRAQEVTPAATVAKKVFQHMEANGHGSGRLIDVTGKPYREENVARTEFEKKAAAAIKSGKPYLDEVGTKDGKPVLRAATVVPVVMKQCLNCHTNHKEGDAIGALIYEIPIK